MGIAPRDFDNPFGARYPRHLDGMTLGPWLSRGLCARVVATVDGIDGALPLGDGRYRWLRDPLAVVVADVGRVLELPFVRLRAAGMLSARLLVAELVTPAVLGFVALTDCQVSSATFPGIGGIGVTVAWRSDVDAPRVTGGRSLSFVAF
jgi:hypothetical protein